MRAIVLGSNGYGGMLLLRLLARHPEIDTVVPASRSQAGMSLAEADPGLPHAVLHSGVLSPTVVSPDEALKTASDVIFSALPHGASADVCAPVLGKTPIIDLSADFRFRDEERFAHAYGTPRPAAPFQSQAVYGLSEWNREAIRSASIIANPGCYPTATLLPLLPIAAAGAIDGPVIVTAMSGISGAGKKGSVDLILAERTENVNAYNVGTAHRHQAEIAEQLAQAQLGEPVLFSPHLVPIKQGMAITTVVPCDPERAISLLEERWSAEPYIELVGTTPPQTRHVRGTNRIRIGWKAEAGHLILMSVIDNLWKGASGQAVQNMNIRFGFPEEYGLSDGIEL